MLPFSVLPYRFDMKSFSPAKSSLGEDLTSVLAQLPTGVAVVSTRAGDGSPLGTTVSNVTAVSSDPPLLVVSLAAGSPTFVALGESGGFMISVLSEHQRAISSRFSGERSASMATGLELIGEDADAPHVAEAIAYLRCEVDSTVALGDRQFVVGKVTMVHSARPELGPLLYVRGGYSRLQGEGGSSGIDRRTVAPTTSRRYSDLHTVAVVGGGFGGAVTAARLLAGVHPQGLRLILVDRRFRAGPDLADPDGSADSLLDLPAIEISAFSERPDHFLRWARRREPALRPEAVVPRSLLDEYLEEVVDEAEREAGRGAVLERVHEEAVGLIVPRRPGSRLRLGLRSGRELAVDRLVLATGEDNVLDLLTADLLAQGLLGRSGSNSAAVFTIGSSSSGGASNGSAFADLRAQAEFVARTLGAGAAIDADSGAPGDS